MKTPFLIEHLEWLPLNLDVTKALELMIFPKYFEVDILAIIYTEKRMDNIK